MSSDGTLSGNYSSSSEFHPNNREIAPSFHANRYNFRRESREVTNRKSLGSKMFVFAGMGSESEQQHNLIPGKKRKTAPDNIVREFSQSNSSNIKISTLSPNELFTFNNARDNHTKETLEVDCESTGFTQEMESPINLCQKDCERHDNIQTDKIAGCYNYFQVY